MFTEAILSTSLVDRVKALLPSIEERAQICEDMRMVPLENVLALRGIGFLDAFKPKAYGGLGIHPKEFYRSVVLLAGACPSTAWSMQLLVAHSYGVAYYDKRLQDEIWGADTDALVSSSLAPLAKATRVEGGVRLSGTMTWSSGCDHATWSMIGFMHENAQAGEREHALAIVPRHDYEIVDTWYAAAMKGTGSKDLILKDVFVPDYRIETLNALNARTARGVGAHADSLFHLPFSPIFTAGFSSVALGIAKAAVAKYRERLIGRYRAYTGAKVADSPPAYMKLAEAHHIVTAAEAMIERDWAALEEHEKAGAMPNMDVLMHWRTNQAFVTRLCVSAVDLVFAASGGGALLETSPLQRMFRDVHGAAAHAFSDYDVASQMLGRHMLGLDIDSGLHNSKALQAGSRAQPARA